jgi:hypothetical protein
MYVYYSSLIITKKLLNFNIFRSNYSAHTITPEHTRHINNLKLCLYPPQSTNKQPVSIQTRFSVHPLQGVIIV